MSYSRVTGHASMVFDHRRNEAYLDAIAHWAEVGTTVIDLGAGLGLLGLAAAKAGASHVYLIEPQPVVQCAREIARRAGVEDRVTIVQDRVEDTRLDARADLIISTLTGNLLFSEDLLPALFDARDRYLKPGGRLLPDRAELWLAPVSAPALHADRVVRWGAPFFGLDVSSLRRIAANDISLVRGDERTAMTRMADGLAFSELDLHTAREASCDAERVFVAAQSGECHGLVAWIRLRLADRWISSNPQEPELHWTPAYLPIDPPIPFQAGESVTVRVHRPQHGEWTWWVRAAAGTRRHSTFLARSEGSREFSRAKPA